MEKKEYSHNTKIILVRWMIMAISTVPFVVAFNTVPHHASLLSPQWRRHSDYTIQPYRTLRPLWVQESTKEELFSESSSKVEPSNTTSTPSVVVNGNDDADIKNMLIDENGMELSSGDAENDVSHGEDPWWVERIFLGISPTPEIVAIMTIYFVEGALGLARLAQTFLLKDELKLGPAELSALTGIFALPWTIKPLYGFLSDGLPLFGYRRRSYLVLAGLVGALSYAAVGFSFWGVFDPTTTIALADGSNAIADIVTTSTTALVATSGTLTSSLYVKATIASLLLSSACVAFSDVVADGIVVQRTRDAVDDPKIAGGLQSLCWGSAAIGGLLSAYFSGSLLEVMGPRQVFALTAVLPLLVAAIALLIDEERIVPSLEIDSTASLPETNGELNNGGGEVSLVMATEGVLPSPQQGVKEQVEALWSALREPAIWRPALFLFLWQSTPTSDGAFLFFMTNDLGFGPEFLGRVRLVTAAAGLVGVWAYQQYLRTVPIKDILFWSSIAATPLGLSNLLLITHVNRDLGIPDGAFVFGDDVALSILGQIAFLPTLVLAARLCPPGVEAVLFATLMSIFNGASTVGTEVGAALTKVLGVTEDNFDNLALLTIICNVSSLYPLLFIGWLDDVGSVSADEMEQEGIKPIAHIEIIQEPLDK
eukprot:scaffold51080_cov45-Attheya_sp.AAC.2